jgi:hypothetical protein
VRTIIKEHRFELELLALRGRAKDADAFVESLNGRYHENARSVRELQPTIRQFGSYR